MLNISERTSCEICGGAIHPLQFGKRYLSLSECAAFKVTDKMYGTCLPMVVCGRCGLAQTRDVLRPIDILPLYSSADWDYLDSAEQRGAGAFRQVARLLGPRLPAGASIFEVGAGAGALLNCFKTKGYRVAGLEPNASFCNFAQTKFGISLINAAAEELKIDSAFTAVIAVDVIEHAVSLQRFMAALSALVEPGGYAIVVTPNRSSLTARLLGRRWWHIRPPHLYYLSPRNLTELARQHGLSLVARQGFVWRHELGYLFNCLQALFFKKILIDCRRWRATIPVNTFDSMTLLFRK